jgi:heptaprenyl diphosphate synthase
VNGGERGERFRLMRQKYCAELFSSRDLCIAGLLMVPGLLFNPDTAGRAAQFFFFWALLWLSGKRNNPVITVLVMVSIVFINLLVPYGKVLLSWGPFRITAGALRAGIHRAVTLEALLLLSRASIRPDLRLPGSFGGLIGESFRIFSRLMERKRVINPRDITGSIDALLLELSAPGEPAGDPAEAYAKKTGARGRLILAAAVLLSWLPPALCFIRPFPP